MPLSLRPPRPDKTPNYEIRGTYLGVRVETSSGTPKRSVAEAQLKKVERCIEEHGCYPEPPPPVSPPQGKTFLSATNGYLQDGGYRRHIKPLLEYFGETPLSDITQDAIDTAARTLFPDVTPATRGRNVYTPVSAIMHHALGDKCPVIRRPKGSKGRVKLDWLNPEDAFAIIEQADKIDPQFGLFLRFLIYTGIRKGEGLNLRTSDVRPEENSAWLRTSKNEDPRMLRLRDDLIAPVMAHLKTNPGDKFFTFRDGGGFKHKLTRARCAAAGVSCPITRPKGWREPPHRLKFAGFHCFRHSWATWMRRYGGADLQGLVATGNWRDAKSAARYAHVVSRDEWNRVDDLPAMGKGRGKAVGE